VPSAKARIASAAAPGVPPPTANAKAAPPNLCGGTPLGHHLLRPALSDGEGWPIGRELLDRDGQAGLRCDGTQALVWGSWWGASNRASRKRAPPSPPRRSRLPPIASVGLRYMPKPKPVPRVLVVTKGSKSCSRTSDLTPGPLSQITIMGPGPSSSQNGPPASRAFWSGLMMGADLLMRRRDAGTPRTLR
jgi:hypothetical protein